MANPRGAEVTPRSLQWLPLGRKLLSRPGCAAISAACEDAGDADVARVRKAGAAAAEAVFRHLDASLDDEDDDDAVFYGQGEKAVQKFYGHCVESTTPPAPQALPSPW